MNTADYREMERVLEAYCQRMNIRSQEAIRVVRNEIDYIWFYLDHNGFTRQAFDRIVTTSKIRYVEDLKAIFLDMELIR